MFGGNGECYMNEVKRLVPRFQMICFTMFSITRQGIDDIALGYKVLEFSHFHLHFENSSYRLNYIGRILTRVRVANLFDPDKTLELTVLVDTGVSHLTLPKAWQEQLGNLRVFREVECVTATQESATGSVCGPVEIQIEGFKPISGEVLFLEMQPKDGQYKPLLGYLPLEASNVAVDILGQRLIEVKYTDLR